MEQANLDRLCEADWTCSVCGRSRQSPYAAPCSGAGAESCRTCGDALVAPARPNTSALRAAIGNHLI